MVIVVLLVLAGICFLIGTIGVLGGEGSRVNVVALGLLFAVLAALFNVGISV